jgi:hypothetical protein
MAQLGTNSLDHRSFAMLLETSKGFGSLGLLLADPTSGEAITDGTQRLWTEGTLGSTLAALGR